MRGEKKSGRKKDTGSPPENHSPLEGESPKPSRQAPAEAVGGSGAPAPLAPSPSPSSSPIKGEETKRKSRRTRRSAPTNTLAPDFLLSCPARSGIQRLWSFSLAHFPHEAGNRERAGVRGKRKAGEEKDTGSPPKITPPLRGSRRSQAARRRLRRWGAQGHPRRWPRHPHLHPLPSRERKRRERAGGHAGPPLQDTLAPDFLLSCPTRSGIQRLWSSSLSHFPHEAGNRERAG